MSPRRGARGASSNGAGAEDEAEVAERGSEPTEFVQTFGRGLAVITAFDMDHPRLTLSDAARRAGVTRAAARRLLHTLAQLGYVRTEGRYFVLRPKVLELGYAYLSALSLPQLGMPYLQQIAETVRESSYMTLLDGHQTVCVAACPMRRIWNASITVGTRLPAYATAAGRVLLADKSEEEIDAFIATAELRQITPFTTVDPKQLKAALLKAKRQGYSVVDDELEEGLRTVAVPIRGEDGVLASLSVSTLARPASTAGARERMLPALQEARESLEADLRSLQHATITV